MRKNIPVFSGGSLMDKHQVPVVCLGILQSACSCPWSINNQASNKLCVCLFDP